MAFLTFRGGIHPNDGKDLSKNCPVEKYLPKGDLAILVSQHIGAPATPIVQKGDKVKTGQLIAQASGFVSANIHSSVSGTVSAIDNIIDAAGLSKPAITIQVEGDEWIPEIDRSEKPAHNITLSKEEIVKAIAAAGIVGMGGATFPTQVKLTPPPGNKAEVLIIGAGIEADIAELETYEEKQLFLEDLGLKEAGVNKLIRTAYHLLNLQTYFTAGPKEVRAWTFRKGMKAPQTAGIIHTDFEKGFIRAEVIKYDDFIAYGSETKCKEAGKMSVEGKDYVVQDGDMMNFRLNV